jgi:hypothetical protein
VLDDKIMVPTGIRSAAQLQDPHFASIFPENGRRGFQQDDAIAQASLAIIVTRVDVQQQDRAAAGNQISLHGKKLAAVARAALPQYAEL